MTQRTVVRLTLAASLLAGLSACCPVPESVYTAGDSVQCRTVMQTAPGRERPGRRVICEVYEGGAVTTGHTSGVGEG